MYDIILFDADGTLYDFDASEKNALSETLEFAKIPVTETVISLYHEINEREWKALERGETTREKLKYDRFRKFSEAAEKLGYGTDRSPEALAEKYVERLSCQCILFPESEEVCRKLSEKCTLYIITNGITAVQTRRFADSPINKYIKATYISEAMGSAKPAPEYFDAVLSDIGITREEAKARALVIGDSLTSDIKGGIGVGLDTCYYDPKGIGAGELSPTYTVKSLYELYEIILTEN